MNILLGILLFVIGALVSFIISRSKYHRPSYVSPEDHNKVLQQKVVAEQLLENHQQQLTHQISKEKEHLTELTKITADATRLETINKNIEEKLKNKELEIKELHHKLQQEFESIANKILLGNSEKIQQQHSQKLVDILNPLKEKITGFEKRVQEVNEQNIRENQSLKEQLKLLQELNKSIGEEARNLTSALKGQVKTQGNWGEIILESILENSGLVKNREYYVQSSISDEHGRRQQPDVLVKLPEEKTIIIDSKVSLVAYERLANASADNEYDEALKDHLTSVKRHIKDLGEKQYQQLYEIRTLDFVLMFIPIEPAFNIAIAKDQELFKKAFDSNIVLVSPSTLLATLRTISSIWKLEYQNRNAREIASQSGKLYDKFSDFVGDMEKIDKNLKQSHDSWEKAMNKLATGRGNLIRMSEKIKKLGAATSKSIPERLLNDSEELE